MVMKVYGKSLVPIISVLTRAMKGSNPGSAHRVEIPVALRALRQGIVSKECNKKLIRDVGYLSQFLRYLNPRARSFFLGRLDADCRAISHLHLCFLVEYKKQSLAAEYC